VNSKIVRFCKTIYGEMEYKVTFKNKAGSNAVTAYSNMKRNISRGLSFAITLLHRAEQN
jgi:hypothetical protein